MVFRVRVIDCSMCAQCTTIFNCKSAFFIHQIIVDKYVAYNIDAIENKNSLAKTVSFIPGTTHDNQFTNSVRIIVEIIR